MTADYSDVDSMLADLLCLPIDGQPRESPRGTVSGRVVRGAAEFIDRSGILPQLEIWRDEDTPDRATRGGAPVTLTDRQVLVVLITLLVTGEPALLTRITEVLTSRLDTRSRDLLRLPTFKGLKEGAVYHRVRRALKRFIAVVDSAPGTPGRRLSRPEVNAIKAARNPEECATKHARLIWLCNQLLEGTFNSLPETTRNAWAGNLCVDATIVKVWGKHGSPKDRGAANERSMSPEIDAGTYYREGDHREPADGGSADKRAWGYDTHLTVMTANDPNIVADFPLLVLGISVATPSTEPGPNAIVTVRSIIERGHPAGMLMSDRAYFPNAKAHKYQLPARALGYTLGGDYTIRQLGIQDTYKGAILVEGSWFSPSMPEPLISATLDYRKGRIDGPTYLNRIGQRTQYMFRLKQKPGVDGEHVLMCPARGSGRTMSCPIVDQAAHDKAAAAKANGDQPKPAQVSLGMPTLTRVLTPPADPGACCTNDSSITIPADRGAKYRQDIQFATLKWHDLFSTLRNTIEGYNGFAKSPTDEDLEQPARRRVRGLAMQSFLIAATVAAANIRKVKAFLRDRAEPGSPPVKRTAHLKRRHSLVDHRPHGPPMVIPGIPEAS